MIVLGALAKLRKATISSVMSVCLSVRICMKYDICVFSKYAEKIQVSLKSDTKNTYVARRPTYMYDMPLHSSCNDKCLRQKI
jgi:hypothetical protein